MATEQEIERLVVRLVGEGDSYQRMLREAQAATDELEKEMKRLGGTEKDYHQITQKAAAITTEVTRAMGAYKWEISRLTGLQNAGRISQESFNQQTVKAQQALSGVAGALQQYNALVAQGTQVTRGTENAAEAYRRRLSELKTLLAAGTISQETFNRALRAARAELVSAGGGVAGFGKQVMAAGTSIRSFGLSWSLYVTAPITAFLTAGAAAGVKMDSLRRGLTAVTGSAEATEAQLAELREVARLPGLGFAEAIEGSIRLQATGFSAQLAKRSLMAFGNALATVGKGKVDLDGVILALTQISSKGKVMAQEINQLGERVPQIRKVMEKAFGTANTEEIQKMGLTSQQFIEGIIAELEKLPKVTGGARNELENLSDAAFVSFSKVGSAILTLIGPSLVRLTELVERLGNMFASLSPKLQSFILIGAGIIVVVGPMVLIIGGATIAFGYLTTAIAASTAAALAFQIATGAVLVTALAAVIYELSGMREVAGEFNAEISRSNSLAGQFAAILGGVRSEILQTADALEGVEAKDFAEKQLTAVAKNIDGMQRELREAEQVREELGEWTNQPLFNWLIGETSAADQKITEIKDKLKAASDFAQELRNRMAAADTNVPKSDLEKIKEQTVLRKETDSYTNSLKRKIETLERGEVATKRASLAERNMVVGIPNFDQRLTEIDTLAKKFEELTEAKKKQKEAVDVAKDAETLTKKLEAQVAAFGKAKEADDIYILSQRGASDATLSHARALSSHLKMITEAKKAEEDLANDVKTTTDKLRGEVAILAGASLVATENLYTAKDAEDLFALAARGATDAVLAETRALAEQKKVLEDRKRLMEEGRKLTEKHGPTIKFSREYKELNKMLEQGAISQETFNKELKAMGQELVDLQMKAAIDITFTVRKNDLVRAGTAEFYELLRAGEEFNRRGALELGVKKIERDVRFNIGLDKSVEAMRKQMEAAGQEAAEASSQFPTATVVTQIPEEITMNLAGIPSLPDMTQSYPYSVGAGEPQTYDVTVSPEMTPQTTPLVVESVDKDKSESLLQRIAAAAEEQAGRTPVILTPASFSLGG